MNRDFQDTIKNVTGASDIYEIEVIQNLWSNYGQIVRYGLTGAERSSVVAKHVLLQEPESHPRGWKSSHSHQRKLKSYQVETVWYRDYSHLCDSYYCKVPECLAVKVQGDEVLMVLEDLDSAGFPVRKTSVDWTEIKSCISWLACFHATFMDYKPEGVWETGTYWHLETRADELEALKDIPLKNAAPLIDRKLKESPYQTLIHGDAKLANFCFSENGRSAAAVDFQYVGGGSGMKDLAYFTGSCLNGKECEKMEKKVLDFYFLELKNFLWKKNPMINPYKVEEDWRSLFYIAWADFHRFMKGWSPEHWKINHYTEQLARNVVSELENEQEK